MTKKTVYVSVVGYTGTGKTGVMQVISKALQEANIETSVDWGIDGPPQNIDPEFHRKRLNSIANKSKVVLSEFQANRKATLESPDDTMIDVVRDADSNKGYGIKLSVMGVTLEKWFGEFAVSYSRAKMIATRLSAELGIDYIDRTTKQYDWVQPQ